MLARVVVQIKMHAWTVGIKNMNLVHKVSLKFLSIILQKFLQKLATLFEQTRRTSLLGTDVACRISPNEYCLENSPHKFADTYMCAYIQ
jgi:hypothetical protein